MNWTAAEIRQLRYRLGLSRAEFARNLNLELVVISAWENGQTPPLDEHRHRLISILHQAESNAERVQRRPIAEAMMRDRGLSQIHDLDVLDSIAAAGADGKKTK